MKDRGSIKIIENATGGWKVETRLVDGNVWMTQYEIARLFGIYEATVRNNLRAIFNRNFFRLERAKQGRNTVYEAIVFISYRTATYQACAFRQWVLKALRKYYRKNESKNMLVMLMYIFENCQQSTKT